MEAHAGGRGCIVGAGIAGLVTAKVLQDAGFDVVVFEKAPTLGGVWGATRTYPGLRANNPRETYAFSDFPYPETADDFPTAEQIRAYLESYTDRFGLRALICLATEVVLISHTQAGSGHDRRFEVNTRPTGGYRTQERAQFDFVAICNGVFSEPYVPQVEGRERFAGLVAHSSEFTDPHLVQGKRVIVVGAGKSALDCATWAARHGQSCTLVFRAAHWMVPRYFFGRIRVDGLLLTRFSELFLRYHRPSRVEALLHGAGRPLVKLWWLAQSRLVRAHLRMPPLLVPESPLPTGIENIGVGDEFYEVLRRGRVVPKRARISSFAAPSVVELDTGERIDADVVIFATGWRQGVDFLDPALRSRVQKNGTFQLYRHILPPEEPHLGFIGYAASLACQLTSEVAAHWLSQVFRGELSLPSVAEMEHEISRVLAWASEVVPAFREGYFIGAYLAHYIDDLMRDMGLRTVRTSNPLTEYLGPLWPTRYRDIGEERRRARPTKFAGQQGAAPSHEQRP